MFDYDAVIIGAGPAGLTSGLYLTLAGWRTLVLEKESWGLPQKHRVDRKLSWVLGRGHRRGSPGQVVTTAGDGAIAAVSAQRTLQQMGPD